MSYIEKWFSSELVERAKKYNVEVHHWEGDEYIITCGEPIGITLHLQEARTITDWLLCGGIEGLLKNIDNEIKT